MKRSPLLVMGLALLLGVPSGAVGQSTIETGSTNDRRQAVPRLIRFSGTLRPEGEQPARGVVEISFSLFKEESGGEPLWFESQTVEVDAQGRYNVLLGAMHPDGLPMDLFTSGEARWLSVMVGKAEQPRILLVSVPYALKAADAESLGGKPATAFVATDQLKEQVASAMSDPKIGLRTLNTMVMASSGGTSTPPAVITETSPATFTCTVATNCVAINQSGAAHALFSQATATSGAFYGVYGYSASTTGRGVFGQAGATTGTSYGVRGQAASTSGYGLHGLATAATGQTYGVWGQSTSTSGRGIFGYATAASGVTYGIFGASTSTDGVGIRAQAVSATGSTYGLIAENYSPNGIAAAIVNLGGGKLISARTTGSVEKFSVASSGNVAAAGTVSGTRLISNMADGTPPLQVTSTTLVPNLYVARANVADNATNAVGATNALSLGGIAAASYARLDLGNSFSGNQSVVASGAGATVLDVQATDLTAANTAIYGRANGPDGSGVIGESSNGAVAIGVWGISTSGLAGQFDGDVNVSGNLSKSGGSFKIDHPMDPANKYLLHSFVESPDMMNIYNGNAALDARGEAVIELPAWFEALNKDFRYQLTAIGAPGPNLYVAEEIRGNHFKITGGSAGMKVSWQVTGVRKDAWANAHRIPVEVQKPDKERGFYLHPELFGAPEDKGLDWANHPNAMKEMRQRGRTAN